MKESFFAISMGELNFDTPDSLKTTPNNLNSSIIRELANAYLDMGAKIYLPNSAESIESLNDVFEAIVSSGCCVIHFETEMSLSNVSYISDQIVAKYGIELMRNFIDIDCIDEEQRLINNFKRCFHPYIVSSPSGSEFGNEDVIRSLKQELSEKVRFGRSLSLDSKLPLVELLSA